MSAANAEPTADWRQRGHLPMLFYNCFFNPLTVFARSAEDFAGTGNHLRVFQLCLRTRLTRSDDAL
ncbi:hypothetical protein CAL7102_07601 [Dulcicalothrix desertica PCC 7102]|nr:hypothetical protein CAL7102_07601 [Dulcicalothrix desertica PCC 7102]